MDVITWLEQSWLVLVAIIGGVTLIWEFCNKTLREVRQQITKPLLEIKDKIDKVEINNQLTVEALLSMQRNFLLKYCRELIHKGYATIEDRETLARQYNSYHDLGGDSFITELVQKACDLPMEKKVVRREKKVDNK